MAREDVERLRRSYEAFNRGKIDALLDDLIDPEFEAHDRSELPDPAMYQGRAGAATAFRQVGELFDDYRVEPQEFIDAGDQVVVVARQSGRGKESGVAVEGPIVHLWRIRDGKAVGLRAFSTREEALESVDRAR